MVSLHVFAPTGASKGVYKNVVCQLILALIWPSTFGSIGHIWKPKGEGANFDTPHPNMAVITSSFAAGPSLLTGAELLACRLFPVLLSGNTTCATFCPADLLAPVGAPQRHRCVRRSSAEYIFWSCPWPQAGWTVADGCCDLFSINVNLWFLFLPPSSFSPPKLLNSLLNDVSFG